jgi:AbrB family looped-hinge helix DNA binding protein
MRAHLSVITRKGQVTLPADIRRTLGLKQGDSVAFRVEDGEVRLTPARATLADGYQSIPALAEPKTWKEIEKTVADERAADYARKGA